MQLRTFTRIFAATLVLYTLGGVVMAVGEFAKSNAAFWAGGATCAATGVGFILVAAYVLWTESDL